MRRPAMHEQRNHRFRLGGKVRIPQFQIERQILARLARRRRQELIALEKMGESKRSDAKSRARQELATGRHARINPQKGTRWRKGVADTGRSAKPVPDPAWSRLAWPVAAEVIARNQFIGLDRSLVGNLPGKLNARLVSSVCVGQLTAGISCKRRRAK